MIRYPKLIICLLQNNLTAIMEYRSDFLIALFMNIIWVIFQLWTIKIYFNFTNNIVGWSENEIFVLVGFVRVGKGIFDLFIRRNLFNFPDDVSQGTLDYNLTRPVNSLFLISTRYHILSEVSTFVSGIIIFTWALGQVHFVATPLSVLLVILLTVMGFLVYYSIHVAFATISFYVVRLSAMKDLHEVVSQAMRYPTQIFSRQNALYLILLLPIYLMATFPVRIILGKDGSASLILQSVLSLAVFYLVYLFWQSSLRHYSSASS